MEHAWCRDVTRDEAVRAAEDGRDRPLPTLAECIDGMFPKSGSATSAAEQENKGDGMATDGMRTERVTLEERITLEFSFDHRSNFRPKEWAATFLPGAVCQGISVRVVEETHFDDLAQVAMQRDTAIRERQKLEDRLSRVLKSSDSMWSQILVVGAERDKLRARVAELEAASGGEERSLSKVWCVTSGSGEDGDEWDMHSIHATRESAVDDADERNRAVGRDWFAISEWDVEGCPQSRGWLTEEEKAAIRWAMSEGFDEEVLRGLLARSSPPKVVLRSWTETNYANRVMSAEEVIAALAAIGVAVKEVGRE